MKTSVFKILIFLFVLLSVVALVKTIVPTPYERTDFLAMTTDAEAETQTSYYFVGSSRIMHAVDPGILQRYLKSNRVYNAGVLSSMFLNNCMIAEYIIRKKGPKIVFVELSYLDLKVPPMFIEAIRNVDLRSFYGAHHTLDNFSFGNKVRIMADATNYAFIYLSLNREFKYLTGVREPKMKLAGYDPFDENKIKDETPFLTYSDLLSKDSASEKHTLYFDLINTLTELGKKNGTRVIFMLPTTSKKKEEREAICAVYKRLPDDLKLVYPASYFATIRKPEYLMDENHLNRKGAYAYSDWLGVQIQNLRSFQAQQKE